MACQAVDHPLVRAKLTVLRDKETGLELFRRTLREISLLIGYEALRDLAVEQREVATPLAPCPGFFMDQPVVVMPILRAGLGMAEALDALLPGTRVGHIGMYRDEVTLEPCHYYLRVPPETDRALVLVVDPMLATGNSAVAAIDRIKAASASRVKLVCLLGCPEGIARVEAAHPDVPIFLAAIDGGLNERGYIMPGLGDAGDRYYGT